MSLASFIVGKYLRSRKDSRLVSLISVISVGGISIGVAVLIIALTVLDGFENAVSEKITDFNSHIYITGFGKRDIPGSLYVKTELGAIGKEKITSLTPFISKSSIVKSKKFYEGIQLIGLPDSASADISRFIVSGEYDVSEKDNYRGVVVGQKLADKLFVGIGDKLTIFSLMNNKPPSISNPPVVDQFVVRGIFSSGMAQYDDQRLYISFDHAAELLDMDDMVSGYNIKLNSLENINELAVEMADALGYPFYVRTIFREHINIFTWLELQKAPIPIILGLITLVAAFNIVGTLLMIIIEKTSAIGTLKSLGASASQITGIFVRMGIILSLTGIALGNFFAFSLSIIQLNFNIISLPSDVYFLTEVPIDLNPLYYLMVSGIAFVICLLASWIPSRIAARVNPVTALRFD
ncbi:MAG: permease [Melioribacteraceae bacterium]|nr:MAG: permease [Melioribacteraceae bacterium]